MHQLPFYSPITAVGPRVGLVEGPAVGIVLGASLGDDDDGIKEGAADGSSDGLTLGRVVIDDDLIVFVFFNCSDRLA